MRAKLALLFLAAVVVFAPAWRNEPIAPGSEAALELAGRVLAPTFDEANAERAGKPSSVGRTEPTKTRGSSDKRLLGISGVPVTEAPIPIVVTAVTTLAIAASRRRATFTAKRAPPLPLTS